MTFLSAADVRPFGQAKVKKLFGTQKVTIKINYKKERKIKDEFRAEEIKMPGI